MVRLIASITLLVSCIASADFYRPGSVPSNLSPVGFERGRAAALSIRDGDQPVCSATVISNQGHVLTALHCLRECTKMQSNSTLKSFRFRAVDQARIKSGKANCSVNFGQESKSLGNHKVSIVAGGAGYVELFQPDDLRKELAKKPKLLSYFQGLMKAGVGIPGDFAIVHVPSLAGRTCAKVTARSPKLAEAIWNVGYPAASKRRNGRGADGTSAMFSNGQITWLATSPTNYQVSAQQVVGLNTNRDGVITSNIDSNTGSSGSGLFAYTGELIGLLNAASSPSPMSSVDGFKGNRYGSNIDFVKQHVAANFGVNVLAQAFNCQ